MPRAESFMESYSMIGGFSDEYVSLGPLGLIVDGRVN